MGIDKIDFIELIDEHSGMIFKIAKAYTKTVCEREDLISEIVLQLWRSSGRFEGRSKTSTWIYRVALNTAMNFNREKKKEMQFLTSEFMTDQLFIHSIEQEEAPEIEILYECIEELDEFNKAIILLYLDGNPQEEIAEITGISKTNVGTRIGRIKEHLKKLATLKNK